VQRVGCSYDIGHFWPHGQLVMGQWARHHRLLIGGALYPADVPWRENLFFVYHLPPAEHARSSAAPAGPRSNLAHLLLYISAREDAVAAAHRQECVSHSGKPTRRVYISTMLEKTRHETNLVHPDPAGRCSLPRYLCLHGTPGVGRSEPPGTHAALCNGKRRATASPTATGGNDPTGAAAVVCLGAWILGLE
jgi:hypothetical protein